MSSTGCVWIAGSVALVAKMKLLFKSFSSLNALTLGPSWGDSITQVWPEIERLSHIFAVAPFSCGIKYLTAAASILGAKINYTPTSYELFPAKTLSCPWSQLSLLITELARAEHAPHVPLIFQLVHIFFEFSIIFSFSATVWTFCALFAFVPFQLSEESWTVFFYLFRD